MFLLVRDVSRYTEWDPIFLGLFADQDKANAARGAYIAQASVNDPWQKQAYKTPDLEKDVRVTPITGYCSPEASSRAYLVTRHLEGMGQFTRWYLAVYSDLEEALARAAREEAEEKVIAEYISVEEFDIDDTRYFEYSSLPFVEFGTGLWDPPED